MKRVNDSEPKEWKMVFTCEHLRGRSTLCGQKWEVREEDIIVIEETVMYECEIEVFCVICPDCGGVTKIHTSQIPQSVQNRCIERYKKEKEEQLAAKAKKNWLKRLFFRS